MASSCLPLLYPECRRKPIPGSPPTCTERLTETACVHSSAPGCMLCMESWLWWAQWAHGTCCCCSATVWSSMWPHSWASAGCALPLVWLVWRPSRWTPGSLGRYSEVEGIVLRPQSLPSKPLSKVTFCTPAHPLLCHVAELKPATVAWQGWAQLLQEAGKGLSQKHRPASEPGACCLLPEWICNRHL